MGTRSCAEHKMISRRPAEPYESLSARESRLLRQLCELRLRVLQHWHVPIGVRPQREELLIRRLGSRGLSRQGERASELKARQRADRIADHDRAVIEHLLKFASRVGPLARRQV